MATKKKKKALKKPAKSPASNSGIITTIIISLVIVAAAAAAGIVVSKLRDKSLAAKNVVSTVSPETITITDTATGKSSKMDIRPASAGNVKAAAPAVTAVIADNNATTPAELVKKTMDAAAKVSVAAKPGDFTYLLNPAGTKETIPHIDIDEAKFLFDSGKAIFVDARGQVEYVESHVKGAVNIPVSASQDELDKLKNQLGNKVLVTYCHGVGCHLADKTAFKLWDAGYKKVAIFFGGWPKWNEHKYPIVTKAQ